MPALGVIGGTLGGIALGSASGTFLSPLLEPTKRSMSYVANRSNPNVFPSLEMLLKLRWAGLCSDSEFESLISNNGVGGEGVFVNGTNMVALWRRIFMSAKPQIPFD